MCALSESLCSGQSDDRAHPDGASTTLLLLKQRLVCCIHQLNPPSTAAGVLVGYRPIADGDDSLLSRRLAFRAKTWKLVVAWTEVVQTVIRRESGVRHVRITALPARAPLTIRLERHRHRNAATLVTNPRHHLHPVIDRVGDQPTAADSERRAGRHIPPMVFACLDSCNAGQ